jgi:hypothetical protein
MNNLHSNDSSPPEPERPVERRLPFAAWWPFAAGVITGIALRLAFSGQPGGAYAAMTASFVYLAPAIVGAVTVYFAERQKRRDWPYYIWAPILANMFFVIGTMLIMIEGLLCAVIIAPLFGLIGAVGGLVMGAVCRLTNWPKQTLLGVALVPLIAGAMESGEELPTRINAVERTVLVKAKPDAIWRQIMNAPEIQPHEVDRAWVFRMGMPLPLAGVSRQEAGSPLRRVTMGKQVYFDEVIDQSQENRYVRWSYRFYQDSFPRYALDEHVVVGGHYFDLIDTAYTLTPVEGHSEVKMKITYRISTRFNWYADLVAQLLLGNVEEGNLNFYRERSERREP